MEQKYCISCDEPVLDKIPPCPLQCMSAKCKAYQRKAPIDPVKKPIVWVLGGPASGKKLHCRKIEEMFGFTYLSTGDLLREEVSAGTARSKCLSNVMERGGLVPNDIVLALLKETMMKAADDAKGFVIDGYPREKAQGQEFERTIAPVSCILYFEASNETLAKRVTFRGHTDNLNVLKLRLQTFMEYNPAVIEAYKDKIVRINSEQDTTAILNEVKAALTPIMLRAQEAIKAAADAKAKADELAAKAAAAAEEAAAAAAAKAEAKAAAEYLKLNQ